MFGLEEFKTFFGSSENNLITLRFSGDGRRTTKKLGSVMTTFSLPVENLNKRSPDKEYCISVYDGEFCTMYMTCMSHINSIIINLIDIFNI